MSVVERETLVRHGEAFSENPVSRFILPTGGVYQWRRDGEFHL